MTVEEVRRVFCVVSQTVLSPLRRLSRQIRHRQRRNLVARLSYWRKALGPRATPDRLKRLAAGPIRSTIVPMQ
jgi:hypothetical protein